MRFSVRRFELLPEAPLPARRNQMSCENLPPNSVRCISAVVVLVIALLSVSGCGKQPVEKPVDPAVEEPADPGAVTQAQPFMKHVEWDKPVDPTPQAICARFVEIDIEQLKSKENERISMRLPCAEDITAVLTDFEKASETRFVWHGAIEGPGDQEAAAAGLVTFAVIDDVLVGDVHASSGKLYSVRYVAKGVSLVEELDPEKFPPEEANYVRSASPVPAPPGTPVVSRGDKPPGAGGIGASKVSDIAVLVERDQSDDRVDRADIIARVPASAEKKPNRVRAIDRAEVNAQAHLHPPTGQGVVAQVQLQPPAGQGVAAYQTQATSESATIDVVVVYTAAAAKSPGHKNGMLAKIDEAVFQTNESYEENEIRQRIKLIHAHQTEYVEKGSLNQDLLMLGEDRPSNELFDELVGLRRTHKADLVVLMTKPALENESCGLANQLQELTGEFCAKAFAVVPVTCATALYSFAHELGHLMGAGHNKGAGLSGSPYRHSCGYISPGNDWRTIMSYTTARCPRKTCERDNKWSRPSLYAGVSPTPQCREPDDASEDVSPNNALTLNKTATTVASFSETCAAVTE